MTTSVGGLIADIGLNIGMLRADVGKANVELSRGVGLMNRSLGGLQRSVGQVGNAFRLLVGAAGLGLLARGVRNVVQEVDGLAKAAKTADITAESLQELRFAFGQIADVVDEQVDQSLMRFTKRLGDASTGNKALAASFASLGVSLTDVGGDARSTEAVLEDSLAALGKIENDAVRAARASDLFGDKVGPKLAQALRGGVSELDRMRKAAHELGIVLSDEMVAGAEETADQFDVLGRVLGTGVKRLILDNVKVIQSLADAFMNVANWAFAGAEKIVDFAHAMGEIAGGAQGFGAEADVLQNQINALKAGRSRRGPVDSPLYQKIEAEISRLQQQQLDVMTSGRNLPRGSPKVTLTGGSSGSGGGGGGGGGIGGGLNEGQRLSPEIRAFVDQLERGEKLAESMRTEVEQQVEAWREASNLFAAGAIDEQTLERVRDSLLQPIEVTAKRMPEILEDVRGEWENVGKSMGMSLQDTLAGAMLGIETNWKDMIKRMLAQAVASKILGAIGAAAGGPFGAFMGFLGFGGAPEHRASGGPVSAGKAYMVGERGPEMFFPGQSGMVAAGGGGGGVVINQTNTFNGGDPREMSAAIAANNAKLKNEIKSEILYRQRRGQWG